MTEAINCPSCGAANQLPEGKTSMFCAFCGNSIEKKHFETKINSQKSNLKKSEIIGKQLAYKDRNIESLDEIINLYSDTELEIIVDLNLSNNRIKSLKGLSKFICNRANFSFNDLIVIDDLPSIHFRKDGYNYINLNFSNNKNLTGFSDNAILKINSYEHMISDFTIYIEGANHFDFETLSKINFRNILQLPTHLDSSFTICYLDSKIEIPSSLKDVGFKKIMTTGGSGLVLWKLTLTNKLEKEKVDNTYDKSINPSFGKVLGNELSNGKCFIATATMGSYDHPEVVVLRNLRDNWILEKKWGEGFVAWYYHYGAIAAKSIEKSFVLKKICYLLIVKPLYILSKLINTKK